MPESDRDAISVRLKAVPSVGSPTGVFVTKVRTKPIKLGKGTKNRRRLKDLKDSRSYRAPLEASLLNISGETTSTDGVE